MNYLIVINILGIFLKKIQFSLVQNSIFIFEDYIYIYVCVYT